MTSINSNCQTPAIAFIGHSNCGKTTLVVKIIAELTARGYRVGSVKHHGHKGFDIDVPGKDSWRHTQAGSVHTVIASPDKLASVRQLEHEVEFPEILETMTDVDVVIVEGYRNGGSLAIELFRSGNPKDDAEIGNDEILKGDGTVATVTNIDWIAEHAAKLGLPRFDYEDVMQICDFVESTLGLSRKG